MSQYIALLLIAVLAVGWLFTNTCVEGYSNYTLDQASGTVPESNSLLVQDSYPVIGKGTISNNGSNDIWRNYPIFEVGSYEQITNNIQFPANPDEGTCMPASMCGALYHKKHTTEPQSQPPPHSDKTRVGFFNTDDTIITSLPYRSETNNILY